MWGNHLWVEHFPYLQNLQAQQISCKAWHSFSFIHFFSCCERGENSHVQTNQPTCGWQPYNIVKIISEKVCNTSPLVFFFLKMWNLTPLLQESVTLFLAVYWKTFAHLFMCFQSFGMPANRKVCCVLFSRIPFFASFVWEIQFQNVLCSGLLSLDLS